DGGKDGLKYYRELFHQLSDVSSWLSATILCEICPEQAQSFKKMVKSYFSKAKFEVVKDLSGRNRVVAVKFFKK
ncbi:MAG: hypothetical protein U1A28_00725, partial [Patescibacteria group bacterium]|nr:hypothetical protein [Patescibacteria group bacterium]